MEPNPEEFQEQMRQKLNELKIEIPKLKETLDSKMSEIGSVEVMSNLAVRELFAQSASTHSIDNPMGENPFFAYVLGLFLIKNNINSGEQMPDKIGELLESVEKYFTNFKWSLFDLGGENPDTDSLVFLSRNKKLFDDLNSHCYPYQKEDHVRRVFSKIDYYLESNYGFKTEHALNYQKIIIAHVEKLLNAKQDRVKELVDKAEEDIEKNKNSEFLKEMEEKGWTKENLLAYYGSTHLLFNTKDIFLINVETFCQEEKIDDVETFRKYLNSISCKIGEQLDSFSDPLSDNIIFYKPIIQLDEDNFFCPKPDFLLYKLDIILENLIDGKSKAWPKYNKSKSDYLEDKTYDFFSRVFPKKNLHRNLYFNFNDKRFECDLLLQYDNKIFAIESKSSHLPLSAKRGGFESLRDSLKVIVRKAYRQGTNVRDYIHSDSEVKFEDKDGNVIHTVKQSSDDEFFFLNVTFENLGMIGTNLKKLDILNFFTRDEYPWSVNIYDLDVITDLISEPVYFLHYLEQRSRAQRQDIFESAEEIDFLGYYFRIGNFYTELVHQGDNLASIMIAPEYYQVLDDCYLLNKPKPKLQIPKKLDELIKNMQKYHQKGFTKITSILLDFPPYQRTMISKMINEKIEKTISSGRVDGKTISLNDEYDIGFSYFTSPEMTSEFYQFCKKQYQRRKYQQKVTRWAVIGRNVSDKKNFATFFIYEGVPWEFNQDMENEIENVFGDNSI